MTICREFQGAVTRCLMELSEANAVSVIDAVPASEVAATAETEVTQSNAVYTLSCIAELYLEAVFPVLAALVKAIQSDDETTQTNALAAIGKIASNYPDAAEPVVAKVVPLLESETKRVRINILLRVHAEEFRAVGVSGLQP